MDQITAAKENIHVLYNGLMQREVRSNALLDITDVLLRVYTTIDTASNPEALINRLANYIYAVGLGNIHLSKVEEQALIDLGAIGQRAGLNSTYRGDYTSKGEFFGYGDPKGQKRN